MIEKKVLFIPIFIDTTKNSILLFNENPFYSNWNFEDENHFLINYVLHNEDLDDFVQLDEACGESELSNGGLWCHIHDAIEVDCDNSYYPAENYHDFDIDWCHYNETYMYTDNMYWGYVSRRNEGWFCNESTNYCYSERDDVYFMDDDVARDRDYEYCESSDDYLHVDDIQESSSEWDNTSDTANLCKKYRKTLVCHILLV